MSIPMRLDRALDEVEAGALLKNLETGRLAVLVDVGDQGGTGWILTLAVVKDKFYRDDIKEEKDLIPNGPTHFRLIGVGGEELMKWLVLTRGEGLLIE